MKRRREKIKLAISKKLFPTFISSIHHQKKVVKKTLFLTSCAGVIAFLIINIILSQLIDSSYFRMINDDQRAGIYYLQSIRKLPQFSLELSKFKNIYGDSFEKAVFAEELSQRDLIQQIEQLLQKNPYSRDLLYRLFFLYDRMGKKIPAQEYLQRAKAIDPSILLKVINN
jgi:tetratricopeptide (TPR) repeat protein